MAKNVIYWFRTDLRLHDSPALAKALELKPTHLYPVWCWDPHYVYNQKVGPNRWQFLLDSMADVSSSITKVNPTSQLFVVRGPPTTVLPALFKSWKISHIVWERDEDPYTAERDSAIEKLAKQAGVEVVTAWGHTLYEPSDIIKKSKSESINSYGPFVKALEKMGGPGEPLDAPKSLPGPGPTDIGNWKRSDHSVDDFRRPEVDVNAPHRSGKDDNYETFAGQDGKFSVPTMKEIGMEGKATSPHRGGETRALEKMEAFLADKARVTSFAKPETNPAAFDPAATTQLSPHLKFGTLSCRLFLKRLSEIENAAKSHTQPPTSLRGQLYWREFFHFNQATIPNYHQIKGNRLAMYLDWRLPNIYKDDDSLERLEPAEEDKVHSEMDPEAYEWLQRYRKGETGYPWIDAIIRQLRQEGWIHHLARHSIACFLTRGHLYISWERGAEVFDDYLVDWDPSLNYGNWMWLSATAFFSQYFRVYSPIAFGKKWDKQGKYVRKYCPELADFPDKFIYQPWEAPEAVQKKAGCIIGKDYPFPIVDEKQAKQATLDKMKENYGRKVKGDADDVVKGRLGKERWWKDENKGAKRKAPEEGAKGETPWTKSKRKA